MDPADIKATVSVITTLVFSKAMQKGGEHLGEAVSDKICQLLSLIRDKLQKEGVEGILTEAQEDPSEINKLIFERKLTEQMEDDAVFAEKMKALMNELNEQADQVLFKDIQVKGNIKIEDVHFAGGDNIRVGGDRYEGPHGSGGGTED